MIIRFSLSRTPHRSKTYATKKRRPHSESGARVFPLFAPLILHALQVNDALVQALDQIS